MCARTREGALMDLMLAFLTPHQLDSGSSSLQGLQSSAYPLPRGWAPPCGLRGAGLSHREGSS